MVDSKGGNDQKQMLLWPSNQQKGALEKTVDTPFCKKKVFGPLNNDLRRRKGPLQ